MAFNFILTQKCVAENSPPFWLKPCSLVVSIVLRKASCEDEAAAAEFREVFLRQSAKTYIQHAIIDSESSRVCRAWPSTQGLHREWRFSDNERWLSNAGCVSNTRSLLSITSRACTENSSVRTTISACEQMLRV